MVDLTTHLFLPGDRIREGLPRPTIEDPSYDPHLAKVHLELETKFRNDPEFRRQHAELLALQMAAA